MSSWYTFHSFPMLWFLLLRTNDAGCDRDLSGLWNRMVAYDLFPGNKTGSIFRTLDSNTGISFECKLTGSITSDRPPWFPLCILFYFYFHVIFFCWIVQVTDFFQCTDTKEVGNHLIQVYFSARLIKQRFMAENVCVSCTKAAVRSCNHQVARWNRSFICFNLMRCFEMFLFAALAVRKYHKPE